MKKCNLFLLFLFCVCINIYGQNSRMIKSIYNGRYLTQKEIQNILPITTNKYGDINTKILHSSAQNIIVWNHSNGRFVKTYEKNQDGKYIWFERNGIFYLELSSTKEETILLNESSGKKYLLTNSDFAEVTTPIKSDNIRANENLSVLVSSSTTKNQKSTDKTTNSTIGSSDFKKCPICSKKVNYGDNYFYNTGYAGLDLSTEIKHDDINYKDFWGNQFVEICCSMKCADVIGERYMKKKNKNYTRNYSNDDKDMGKLLKATDSYVDIQASNAPKSSECCYCEKKIIYGNVFYNFNENSSTRRNLKIEKNLIEKGKNLPSQGGWYKSNWVNKSTGLFGMCSGYNSSMFCSKVCAIKYYETFLKKEYNIEE